MFSYPVILLSLHLWSLFRNVHGWSSFSADSSLSTLLHLAIYSGITAWYRTLSQQSIYDCPSPLLCIIELFCEYSCIRLNFLSVKSQLDSKLQKTRPVHQKKLKIELWGNSKGLKHVFLVIKTCIKCIKAKNWQKSKKIFFVFFTPGHPPSHPPPWGFGVKIEKSGPKPQNVWPQGLPMQNLGQFGQSTSSGLILGFKKVPLAL